MGNAQRCGNTNGAQGALLPDVSASHEARQGKDRGNDEHALDGSIDDAECQSLGVVFVPGLDIEGEKSWLFQLAFLIVLSLHLVFRACMVPHIRSGWDDGGEVGEKQKTEEGLTSKQNSYRLPAVAHVLGGGKNEHLESRVQGIDTVIEEFAEGSGLFGSSTTEIRLRVSALDAIRAPSSPIHIKQRVDALKAIELTLGHRPQRQKSGRATVQWPSCSTPSWGSPDPVWGYTTAWSRS